MYTTFCRNHKLTSRIVIIAKSYIELHSYLYWFILFKMYKLSDSAVGSEFTIYS
jgi:hypothetical protein